MSLAPASVFSAIAPPAELVVDDVVRRYPGSRGVALDGVSVTVEAGTTLAVLGPSGCGKSTLLRAIAGIEPVDRGRILLGGAELSRRGWTLDQDRRDVNMVFQSYALWPHLRVRDIIGYGLAHGRHRTTRARREERVAELVALLRLDGLEDRRPAELSGGQQQRVAIARALATEPGLLLFDEPLSNLDVQLRAAMRLELAALLGRIETTAVYVTHDATEALALADRVLVLAAGRAVQHDTPRGVFARPATPWVAAMAGFATRLEPTRLEPAAGKVRAVLAGGALVGRDCGAGDGSPAVLVHPDAVRVAHDPFALGDGRLRGVVLACAYEGRDHRVSVALPGGGAIAVRSADPVPTSAEILLEIEPEGVVVFGAA